MPDLASCVYPRECHHCRVTALTVNLTWPQGIQSLILSGNSHRGWLWLEFGNISSQYNWRVYCCSPLQYSPLQYSPGQCSPWPCLSWLHLLFCRLGLIKWVTWLVLLLPLIHRALISLTCPNPGWEVSQNEQMLQLLQERQQFEAWKARHAQPQVSQMQAAPIGSLGPTISEKVKIDDDVEVISVGSCWGNFSEVSQC